MTEANTYVTVNGHTCDRARVTVGHIGPWTAELHLSNVVALTGAVTLRIGSLALVGAVVPGVIGTYAEQLWVRIAGGAAGWSLPIGRKGYHNDAGVKAQLVAEDAAREVGETLGDFVPTSERVGIDYARETGLASTALSRAIGPGAAWWVDYAGVTQVGQRPSSTLPGAAYQVLSFNPSDRTATLLADDPSRVTVGATISDGIDRPSVVRELEIVVNGNEPLRIHVWLGGESQQPGRIAALVESLVRRVMDGRLYGAYRYRVVSQSADDRVDLQAVDLTLGLPDLRAITLWPGVAGARMKPGLGGQALVMFAEGDRARPLVMSYAPSGAAGFAPVGLVLGGMTGDPAARKGDQISFNMPHGQVGSAPVTWTPHTPSDPVVTGTITSGSSIVSIAPEDE
jgi:hypothetical protein